MKQSEEAPEKRKIALFTALSNMLPDAPRLLGGIEVEQQACIWGFMIEKFQDKSFGGFEGQERKKLAALATILENMRQEQEVSAAAGQGIASSGLGDKAVAVLGQQVKIHYSGYPGHSAYTVTHGRDPVKLILANKWSDYDNSVEVKEISLDESTLSALEKEFPKSGS